MDESKIYWQDVAALCAGIWLMLTLAVGISTETVASGWLAYISGGMIAAFAAGGFQDNAPLYAWLAAAFGVVATLTPWLAGISASPLATGTIAAGGLATVVFSLWSAFAKRTAAPAPQPALAAAE
jgi:uncharacterized membrane protein HdeD (DUF308 family)